MSRPKPEEFDGGNDLGPIGGALGWRLSVAYTFVALALVTFLYELVGWILPLVASVIGP